MSNMNQNVSPDPDFNVRLDGDSPAKVVIDLITGNSDFAEKFTEAVDQFSANLEEIVYNFALNCLGNGLGRDFYENGINNLLTKYKINSELSRYIVDSAYKRASNDLGVEPEKIRH